MNNRPSEHSQDRAIDRGALLAGYPGAALLARGDGSVVAANAQAAGLKDLIERGQAPEIAALIGRAAEEGRIASGAVALPGAKGKMVLEVTALPLAAGGELLVIARDMTMERNLRSVLVESRQRYKDLVEVSSDFAWEIDSQGRFAFVSPRGALGYKAEDLVERRPEEFVTDPDSYSPLPFLSDRPLENVEMWMRRADGSVACVIISCLPLLAEDGSWHGARGICRDITEEREGEAALARARNREQLLNYIVSTIRDEVEPTNMLSTAAGATARALGAAGCNIYRQDESGAFVAAARYGNTEGLGELDDFLSRLDGEVLEFEAGRWRVLAAATHYRKSVNGAICMWRDAAKGPWEDDNLILIGDVANQLGIANEQIAIHERIVKLSRTDALTGLLNRRAFFEEELPRRQSRLDRSGFTATLLYLDLDNFKLVNDVHGHQRGDEAILFLRDMLIKHSRPIDVIARLGGDEFAVWLDGITPEVAIKRVEKLVVTARELKQFSGDADHPLGVSIGVAMYDPNRSESMTDLIARADGAMYVVKRAGKGGYIIAPPPGTAPDGGGDDGPNEE